MASPPEPPGASPASTSSPADGEGEPGPRERRWALVRDLLAFSLKAGLEALRDVALIPVALLAGLVGLVFSPERPERYFARVLRLGDRFDHFVDLFGSARQRRRAGLRTATGGPEEPVSVDDVVDWVEQRLRREIARGGAAADAFVAVDRALERVQDAVRGDLGPEGPIACGEPPPGRKT